MKKLVVALTLVLHCSTLFAGGSAEQVKLLQFAQFDGQFLLVVEPVENSEQIYKDPYMGKCKIFSVIGHYDVSLFAGDSMPSEEEHIEALQFLTSKPDKFRLGWMGSGFNIADEREPCVMQSRAIKIWKEKGIETVVSYYESM